MRPVVFLGPSLALTEAQALQPDAIFLPPARQGDLISAAVNHGPAVIGLIDGEFLQSQSVWHKEILFALEHGIEIYGSSSIGALRAAETDVFGMVGVGEVYAKFAGGELTDDDEVALVHGPREDGYPALSYPLVNLRATVAAAVASGRLKSCAGERFIQVAKRLFFPERVLPRLQAAATLAGISAADVDAVTEAIRSGYIDVKADDARELLSRLTLGGCDERPTRAPGWLAPTSGLDTLYNRERRVVQDGELLPLADIAELVALEDSDFDRLNFDAMNRHLAGILGRLVGIEVSGADCAAESARFRARHALTDECRLGHWLVANHLSRPEYESLMREAATCRALHRWVTYARFTERTTRILLDHLRWENRYQPWARKAATQQRTLADGDVSIVEAALERDLGELLREQAKWTDFTAPDDVAEWAEWAGFPSTADLQRALARCTAARAALLERILATLPSA